MTKAKKTHFGKLQKKTLIVLIFCIIAIVIGSSIIAKNRKIGNQTPEIITEANLKKIINVSDLSTLEAVYNGVAKVMNEKKPEKVDYYVSYDAKVKVGIDFEQVQINVDHDAKLITVILPEIKITDVDVDVSSLDYIFINDKANTETVSGQAYKKCLEDVTNEIGAEDSIYDLAKENAVNIISALIEPFINQLDEEYQLEIK